jgi:hypothetical protein
MRQEKLVEPEGDEFSPEEAERRMVAAIRGSLITGHKTFAEVARAHRNRHRRKIDVREPPEAPLTLAQKLPPPVEKLGVSPFRTQLRARKTGARTNESVIELWDKKDSDPMDAAERRRARHYKGNFEV